MNRKTKKRIVYTTIILLVALTCGFVLLTYKGKSSKENNGTTRDKLTAKAEEAWDFAVKRAMNTDFCVLIDMSIDMDQKRFFVYDFAQSKVIYSSIVCHGRGKGSTRENPVFSNVPGSNCTSLGKYRIGNRAHSQWGINIHYKLHGLEPTNSNAYKRYVVLHSYSPVPCEEPTFGYVPMCSEGCPVICNDAMRYMDNKLQHASRPVLLWIYK